ncbi:DDE-type integrase/transposase/recombinase [Frankia sp. CiP1_Cm_nod1]|uniref:DDE-type integrase/transposase/recombinase n=3 Tax=unclassified Frankia TaxID=2632575 RepID=UPI00404487CB
MSLDDDDEAARRARAREIGLFRYMLIRDLADEALTTRQRGVLVRALAAREHVDPDGRPVRVTRWTLDRWVRSWKSGGFDALVPSPRQAGPRTPADVLALASALKRERPERTAAQVRRILVATHGWSPTERTLQRFFTRTGIGTRQLAAAATGREVFSPFQAAAPNDLWTGDALHAVKIAGRKTYLFAFLDDYSRAVVGYRFGYAEDTVRLAAALRPALAARGIPSKIYVDNGSAFSDAWLLRACAKLGIRLAHSTPHRPEGRGKIERFFATVRGQFLVEIADEATPTGTASPVTSLDDLNGKFQAWVEAQYHRQVHTETGAAPLHRWQTGGPFRHATPDELTEAFRWSTHRTVSRTGLISLHANRYQVPAGLAGQRVECVFDPFDLTTIALRLGNTDIGTATPFEITRHSHPKARPETPTEPARPTQIDYLALVQERHTTTLTQKINYAALADTPGQTGPDDPAGPQRKGAA